jgi:thiol-disulfide isomerase/thioredoxin
MKLTPESRTGRLWKTTLVACVVAPAVWFLRNGDHAPAFCPGSEHACTLPSAKSVAARSSAPELPDGPVLLEFTSEACPACRAMEPVLQAARAQCQATGAGFVPIDADSIDGTNMATRLGVAATPTLVILDGKHQEAERLVGLRSLADVRKAIEETFGVACRTAAGAPRSSG